MVRSNDASLVEALKVELPKRFDSQRLPSIDYPWTYGSALLEAAIAAATLADEPYDVNSESVKKCIDELVAKLKYAPRSTVVRLVADVDVDHVAATDSFSDSFGESVQIGSVRVVRVGNLAERFVERELPSAGYELGRSEAFVHPGPASLIVATIEAMEDEASRTAAARQQVLELITAIRLATSCTAHAVIDIQGDPDNIHAGHPRITPLPSWDFRFVHRPATLSGSDVNGLVEFVNLIRAIFQDDDWTTIRVAIGRLSRSLDGLTQVLADQTVDLAIGLEAALAGIDKDEIGLRLRSRSAHLLAADGDPADAIYRDVKTLYDLRSRFVHGSSVAEKTAANAIGAVTAAAEKAWPRERYLLALDRWRDLLRRAILARIALATASVPWPAKTKEGKGLDVDELLLRDSAKSAWHDHIRRFWDERGPSNAFEPAGVASFVIDPSSR